MNITMPAIMIITMIIIPITMPVVDEDALLAVENYYYYNISSRKTLTG